MRSFEALDTRLEFCEALLDDGILTLEPRPDRPERGRCREAPWSATTIDASYRGYAIAQLELEQPASRLPWADAARRGDVLREEARALSKRTGWAVDAPRTGRRRRDAVPLTMATQMDRLPLERPQAVRHATSRHARLARLERGAADPADLCHLRSSRIRARA